MSRITAEEVAEIAFDHFDETLKFGDNGQMPIADAVAVYLMRKHTKASIRDIWLALGSPTSSNSQMLKARVDRVQRERWADAEFRAQLERCESAIDALHEDRIATEESARRAVSAACAA